MMLESHRGQYRFHMADKLMIQTTISSLSDMSSKFECLVRKMFRQDNGQHNCWNRGPSREVVRNIRILIVHLHPTSVSAMDISCRHLTPLSDYRIHTKWSALDG
jgi:hypothetical protein